MQYVGGSSTFLVRFGEGAEERMISTRDSAAGIISRRWIPPFLALKQLFFVFVTPDHAMLL